LLNNVEEGLAGEYRKVSIGVEGSQKGRAPAADVHALMCQWFEKHLIKGEREHMVEFLARIHSQFQYIHPFRDGNGRIGRLVMNLFLLTEGYPVLTFPSTLSNMFNHGTEMGHRGDLTIFKRLVAESLFASLQAYEDAMEVQLLPAVEDTIKGV
jgi:fido (protein-threonine AMPylation protein)